MSGRSRNSGGAAAIFAAALCFFLPFAAAGEIPLKAQACVACHGPGGNSTDPAMPSLAGQPAQFISMQLFMFREGNRKDPQMSPMASSLSNADMNELAAYFSSQKPAAALHETASENAAAGRRLAEQHHCVQCHGPALLGLQHIPRLAGQQFAYLRTQLRGFKAGTRADFDGNMTSAAELLSEKDIEILADYLSGLTPPRD
ncbi:MAG TPA: c-type cytochrome [Burkholderiales bacterium]|nr:c-type cytochrome [Burkholderiales bacterium]